MEWLAEFGGWFGLVALAFGGPALVQHHFSQSGVSRRRILRSERRVRKLKDITERFERMQAMQRSIEARQAALDTPDQEHLGTLQHLCTDLAARAAAERRTPGSTTLAQDLEALLDAAASLGNEYTRSASLGHILELYVDAGLYEQARGPRPLGDRLHGSGPPHQGSPTGAGAAPGRSCAAADAGEHSGAGEQRRDRGIVRAEVRGLKDGEASAR